MFISDEYIIELHDATQKLAEFVSIISKLEENTMMHKLSDFSFENLCIKSEISESLYEFCLNFESGILERGIIALIFYRHYICILNFNSNR